MLYLGIAVGIIGTLLVVSGILGRLLHMVGMGRHIHDPFYPAPPYRIGCGPCKKRWPSWRTQR
jgi:hypothetical protein